MTPVPFLSAKWQHLMMINYEIDPLVLTATKNLDKSTHPSFLDMYRGI
ncbi:MAG: hypothetical protein IM537_07785 [Pseudanabaena sp. M57BS1SP1A06MG]|nr:hypothetical protein [Pseudanabaena sp. M57BS1SP1A06MG]